MIDVDGSICAMGEDGSAGYTCQSLAQKGCAGSLLTFTSSGDEALCGASEASPHQVFLYPMAMVRSD